VVFVDFSASISHLGRHQAVAHTERQFLSEKTNQVISHDCPVKEYRMAYIAILHLDVARRTTSRCSITCATCSRQ
jgi:hypothetical protein